jgi:hypothetical protein
MSGLMVTVTILLSKLAHIPAAGCWAYGVARALDIVVASTVGVDSITTGCTVGLVHAARLKNISIIISGTGFILLGITPAPLAYTGQIGMKL